MKITKTSQKGIDLIKRYEGFRSKPYLCPAGVPTIGYGTTVYPNGRKVRLTDPAISEAQAVIYLKTLLKHYESGVDRYVRDDINQHQFDALVSFAYNLGLGALQRSTLLKRVNANPNDKKKISYEFQRWTRAAGRVLKGLERRREDEVKLYFS